ncbi:MAG: 50S ribosomal protein L25/general stress protein Ctc [Bacteroidetes bacterium]|nr:50S ribosomal protein L25/general stress protein Ctc [Bacteroidota bacterium]
MKTVSLSGSPRENVGKKDAKKNRMEGKVPCVIYGGKEQVHFSMDEKNFKKILFTTDVYIIEFDIAGKKFRTILQDIQYHPVTDKVLHADFLEVTQDNPVKLAIPVKITGSAPGVIKGGKLIQKMRKLKVKGLIDSIPESFPIDVSSLDIGQSVKIRDLSFENIQILESPSAVVAVVKTTRAAAAGTGAEEEAEGEEAEKSE